MLNVKADPYPALIPFISPMTLAQFQKPHTSPPPLPLPLSLSLPVLPPSLSIPQSLPLSRQHSFFIFIHFSFRVIPESFPFTHSLCHAHTPSLFHLMGSRPAVCLWTENSKWLLRLTVSCTGARTYLRARTHTHTHTHKDTQTHTH